MQQTPIFPSVVRRIDGKLAREPAWAQHRSRIVPRAPRSAPALVDWAVAVLQAGALYALARFVASVRPLDSNGAASIDASATCTAEALVQLATACEVLSVAADYLADTARAVRAGIAAGAKIEDPIVRAIVSVVQAFGAEKIALPPEEEKS